MSAPRGAAPVAFIVVVGCAGCPSADRPPRDLALDVGRVCATDLVPAKSASALRATLRVLQPRVTRIQDLVVEGSLSNTGSEPVRWLGTYVDSGSVALEVRDSSCQTVPPGPPPTPNVDDGVTNWSTLAPGASARLSFHGWVMSDVPPGRYEVRFKGVPGDTGNADVRSAWVPFDVVAADGGT